MSHMINEPFNREYNTFQDNQYSVGIQMDSQIYTNYAQVI